MSRTRGLAYERTGSGAATLLIHAGIADRSMWDPQWESFAGERELLRYDQRGFGESEDPDRPYSLHGDAAAVLDAAGIERAVVIGASLGGRAALDLALAAPERVAALVLVAATPSGWEHDAELIAMFEAVDAAYRAEGVEAANELELRIWADGPRRDPDAVDPAVRRRVARMNREALLREQRRESSGAEVEPDALEPPALDRLESVEAPTLVVTGELDQPSVNAGAAEVARRVSGAAAIEIPGTAHLPSLERPELFDRTVREFLGRSAPAQPRD